jgi:aspartate/glutamate racemase
LKILICCVIAHYLLPEIPDELRARVISLVDLIIVAQRKQLLLCTNATRQLNIFQLSNRWQDASKFVVLPEAAEQSAIHDLIYQNQEKLPHSLADAIPGFALGKIQSRFLHCWLHRITFAR